MTIPVKNPLGSISRFLLSSAALVILIAGVKAIAPLLNTVLLAFLLAPCFTPLMNLFMRLKIPRGLAVCLTILIVLVVGLALVAPLAMTISLLIERLPVYELRLVELKTQFKDFLTQQKIDASEYMSLDFIEPKTFVKLAGSFLVEFSQAVGQALVVFFLVALVLLEAPHLSDRLRKFRNDPQSPFSRISEFSEDIRKYVTITGLTGFLIAGLNFILLFSLGIDFALIWAVLSFLLNFVPTFGFLFSVIPPAILALLQFGWGKCVIVIFGFTIFNALAESVIKPKFMAEGLGLSPLTVILSLMFWGWVLGPLGAILAVPVTIIVKKAILEVSEETEVFASLLGSHQDNKT